MTNVFFITVLQQFKRNAYDFFCTNNLFMMEKYK